jgi:hypothetical protein
MTGSANRIAGRTAVHPLRPGRMPGRVTLRGRYATGLSRRGTMMTSICAVWDAEKRLLMLSDGKG